MRNTNKDYTFTMNAKTGAVTAPAMVYAVTDKNTSNMFCQLVFTESNSPMLNYAPNENAEDYTITLRIVKPNNEPKEIVMTILNATSFVYMVDLEDECKDIIGSYKCECFIDCMINNRLERLTSNEFTYTVRRSIMNDLDDVIEGDPDYPLIDEILDRIESIEGGGGSGGDTVNPEPYNGLTVIGSDASYHTLVPDDIDANVNKDYIFKKVKIKYDNKTIVLDDEIVHVMSSSVDEMLNGSFVSRKQIFITMDHRNETLVIYETATGFTEVGTEEIYSEPGHTHTGYLTAVPDSYATKEYVDSAVAQDNRVYDMVVSSGLLTLGKSKYQKADLIENVIIRLPQVSGYTEIHLFLRLLDEVSVVLPPVKYQNTPTFEMGKVYELIFTYIGNDIWLAGVVAYE